MSKIEKLQQISVDDMLNSLNTTVDEVLCGKEKKVVSVHLSKAPNIIEWVIGREFLAQPQLYKYKRQYQVLRDFFQLRCPLCNPKGEEDVWEKGKEYLESENLLIWSEKDFDDKCPRCGWTRRELEDEELLRRYNTMIGCAGMRSGKSMTAAFIASYLEHNSVLIENLQEFFGVIERQRMECAFVATTATQTKDTIYDTYASLRGASPWICKYIKSLEERQKNNELYKEYPSGAIEFREKRLFMMSLNSNSSGLAGKTRVAGFIDELSRFDLSESKRSADEIFSVINHSLLTVRAAAREKNLPNWVGLMICVSSPISENDKTMQMLKVGKNSKTIYTFHYATTQFNPTITTEDLAPEYEKDEIMAERDFGAEPPGGKNPLILHWKDWFEKSCNYALSPTANFSPYYPIDQFGQEYVAIRLDNLIADRSLDYYISIDAGKSGDSFTMAMGHGVEEPDVIGNKLVTVLDFIINLQPTSTKIAYFKCIADILKELQKRIRILKVQYDHWQSESQIQELRDIGIWAEAYNMRATDYENIMRDGYTGRLRLLPPTGDPMNDNYKFMTPETKYWWEARALDRSSDLKRVDHPSGGSNDLIQVVCGVHRLVVSSKTVNPEDKKEKTKHQFKKWSNRAALGSSGMSVRGLSRWASKRDVTYTGKRNIYNNRKGF